MTGPEHYRDAERNIEYAKDAQAGGVQERFHLDVAQVHATLALAAATALGREGEGRTMTAKDRAAWFDVAAECRKQAAE